MDEPDVPHRSLRKRILAWPYRERVMLWWLLGLLSSVPVGVGLGLIKGYWGEGLATGALFVAGLIFGSSVLSRLLGVHPSQTRKSAVDGRLDV